MIRLAGCSINAENSENTQQKRCGSSKIIAFVYFLFGFLEERKEKEIKKKESSSCC